MYKFKAGDDAWIYDQYMKERRPCKVLEVLDTAKYGYAGHHYLIELSCHVDCWLSIATNWTLFGSKE